MTSAIDGLVSGLDTTSLINSLMQLQAAPQTALKTKQTANNKVVTALQGLNTKIASLAESAASAAKATSWSATAATSSSTAATAITDSTAVAGSVSFRVNSVAQSQVSVSNVTADDNSLVPDYPAQITVKKGDGSLVTVEPTTGSLADITSAINQAASAGVRATAIRVGDGEYRIQFTGTITGAENSFEVYAGDAAAVTAGTATRIDGNVSRTAADASITLWDDGGALATTITQASNTFTDLMSGVDVTVTATTAVDEEPVTVTVAQDSSAITNLAKSLVDGLTSVLSDISAGTKSTTSTSSDGRSVVTGGVLSGESSVRSLRERLASAASMSVNGVSPSSVGIELDRDGNLTFDEEVFASALAANPAEVQGLVSALATRVSDVADPASDSIDGTFTLLIKNKQSLSSDYGKRIEEWDDRLELRRSTLERQYAALEVALSNLQSQSDWLTTQLDQLSANSSS